ncbi:MAG: hypothetical protein ACYS6W_04395 [Planctomycetota bacterium]|jgi:hypothetical protein
MSYDTHFLIENVVDVTAAVIGISKQRWYALKEGEENVVKAREVMEKQRFDILPIVSDSGVKEYFQADSWNDFSSISRKQITDRDVIHFQTPLRDLIHKLASKSRLFFFLSDETEVVGLVSIVHLNSRQVKVYLYNLLSELEIGLSHFLSARVSEEALLEMEFETSDEENDKVNTYEKIKEDYKDAINKGVDVSFTECLYLSHFIRIIRKMGLHKDLGYSGKQYDRLGSMNDLRHKVAHPNRSIITDANSVERLWKQITRIEKALSKLSSYQEVC